MLVIAVGEQSAQTAVFAGIPCIGLAGALSWTEPVPDEPSASRHKSQPAAILLEHAGKYQRVLILGGSECLDDINERDGLERLAEALKENGIRAELAYCPPRVTLAKGQLRIERQGLSEWLINTESDVLVRYLSVLYFAAEVTASSGLTDSYNARMMSDLFAGELSYSRGDWHVWDGRIWRKDGDQARRKLPSRLAAFYRENAEQLQKLVSVATGAFNERELPRCIAGWAAPLRRVHEESLKAAKSIQNLRTMDAAFAIAQAHLSVPSDRWDRDSYLLAVHNGVVNLRTGDLHPHSPEFLITRSAGCRYDPEAIAPTFEKFLSEVQPDPAVRSYLQRLMGYAATGDAKEQKLFTFHGGGANGKSTFIGIVMEALGEYAVKANASLLAEQTPDRPRNDLAALAGARLVSISEIPANLRADAALIKSLTGGDVVTARFLHKEFFQFRPCFTPILDTNHPLVFRERSEAVTRRAVTMPWLVTVVPENRDSHLRDKLLQELPGILAWIVDGARMYYSDGLGSLPQSVDLDANTLSSVDPVAQWLNECTEGDPICRTPSSALYRSFCDWSAHRSDIRHVSIKEFSRELASKGYQSRKNSVTVWLGIRIRS